MVFGTLYPAYRSYKAIKNKDVREYVKWMMYWIIFALFTAGETFADIFLSWLPLYYEIKIIFIIWLLSPATKGSSILYRKFVHPRLVKHEKAIDKYISKAQRNSYAALMDVGKKGLNVASDAIMKTAVTGQYQLVQTLRKYNSMQDLNTDNTDAPLHPDRGQRVNTWYGGPPQNYDPNDDLAILQRQYREDIAEESYPEHVAMQRSASDIDLRRLNSPDVSRRSDSPVNGGNEEPSLRTNNENDDGITINTSEKINYAYSSSTLPRSRKPRKPLYEKMPNSRRSTRSKVSEQSSY